MESTSNKNHEKPWPWILVPISFFALMLGFSTLFGLVLWNKSESLIISCFAGAAMGFIASWFPVFIIMRFYLFISRGVPFREGQIVEITKGPHKGSIGEIIKRDSTQARVQVKLNTNADGTNILHIEWFDWLEVRRSK